MTNLRFQLKATVHFFAQIQFHVAATPPCFPPSCNICCSCCCCCCYDVVAVNTHGNCPAFFTLLWVCDLVFVFRPVFFFFVYVFRFISASLWSRSNVAGVNEIASCSCLLLAGKTKQPRANWLTWKSQLLSLDFATKIFVFSWLMKC